MYNKQACSDLQYTAEGLQILDESKAYHVLPPCYLLYRHQEVTHAQTEASHHALEPFEIWVSSQQTTAGCKPVAMV